MSAPQFQTVLFIHEDSIRLFYLPQKNWHALDESALLSEPIPAAMREKLSDKNVLVLVSDSYCGHLQFTRENKKTELTESAITQVLQDEYEIDTDAYELSWQNSVLSRQMVQLSVSGVEKDVLSQTQKWLEGTGAKKVWVMPFGWFLSTLKSVDPALIALLIEDQLHVSHHYLGIDDARVLDIDDIAKYVRARQKERKETHLLYLQTPARKRKLVEKQLVGVEISTQSLLVETSDDVLLDVVQAVLSKGQETIGELLHFEFELAYSEVAASTPAVSTLPAPATPVAAAIASDLPRPLPPVSLRNAVEVEPDVEDESAPVLEEPVAQTENAPVSEAVIEDEAILPEEMTGEIDTFSPTAAASVVAKEVAETSSFPAQSEAIDPTSEYTDDEDFEELPPKKEKELAQDKSSQVLASLKNSGVHSSNGDRYAQMEEKKSWKGPILVFFLVVTLTAVVGGAIFWSQEGVDSFLSLFPNFRNQSPVQLASPTPMPTVEPSPVVVATESAQPAPEEKVDKATPRILILNATGITGYAGKIKTKLEAAGWEKVSVGNATGTYADATFVQTEMADAIPVLGEDLGKTLKETTKLSEAQAANYDIVLVLAEE